MTIIEKPAAEAIKVVFDFTLLLQSGDSISGTPTVSQQEAGETSTALTVGTPSLSSPRVTAVVGGGESGKLYVLSCAATATGGQTLVAQVGVSVP